jgi:hypothetical protein
MTVCARSITFAFFKPLYIPRIYAKVHVIDHIASF